SKSRRMNMLVLTRKQGEKIVIGDEITVGVVRVTGNKVVLAFDAPGEVRIVRAELGNGQDRHLDPSELDLKEKPADWEEHSFDTAPARCVTANKTSPKKVQT